MKINLINQLRTCHRIELKITRKLIESNFEFFLKLIKTLKTFYYRVSHRNHNRKLCNEKQWYEHCKTLQRLSTPKTEKVDTLCVWPRGKKVALSKLCPRINYLSQPKNPIKKRAYLRDPDEIVLPGKIKDWQEHCLWLHKNAQPKKYQNLDYVQVAY